MAARPSHEEVIGLSDQDQPFKACDECGENPASIVFADVVNNQKKTQRHLCQSCYEASGFALPLDDESIAKLLGDDVTHATVSLHVVKHQTSSATPDTEVPDAEPVTCPECEMTLAEFRDRKAVGCQHDYDLFDNDMESLVLRLHGSLHHVGKTPSTVEDDLARRHQVAQLEADLDRAVESELYEDAARLRDRISALSRGSSEHDGL